MSCRCSRPGRFTGDSGRWKKICRAVGISDMPLFWGGAIHACHKPHVAPWEVPTPLDTKDTQSQQGAKILYNRTWFCTCGPNFKVVWIPLSHSCPDIWVREPDWLHFPYSGERPFCGYSWLYCFASSRVFCFCFYQWLVRSMCVPYVYSLFISFFWVHSHGDWPMLAWSWKIQ